jgi:hypothetical protein
MNRIVGRFEMRGNGRIELGEKYVRVRSCDFVDRSFQPSELTNQDKQKQDAQIAHPVSSNAQRWKNYFLSRTKL